jgi:hemin uptake protein HemP
MTPTRSTRDRQADATGVPRNVSALPRVIDSMTLLGTRHEVRISHNGAVYTLRLTRQGKLILTK